MRNIILAAAITAVLSISGQPVVPAVLARKQAEADKIAGGVQKQRYEKMMGIIKAMWAGLKRAGDFRCTGTLLCRARRSRLKRWTDHVVEGPAEGCGVESLKEPA